MASENNSNDLDAFFKKQKQKKKKRGGVQDVDALGKKLDKNVRRQEQFDREEEERTQRTKESERPETLNEDSEWYTTPDVDSTAVKLKDMDMAEQEEDQRKEQDEESRENVKTWNVAGENTPAEVNGDVEEKPPEDEGPKLPKKYVPPSIRVARGRGATAAAPALGDQEAFPTLGAAEEIEKEQEQAKKRQEHIKLLETTGGGRHESNQKENENDGFITQVYRAPRDRVPGATPNAWATKPAVAPAPAAAPEMPKAGSYVPPHLRSQQTKVAENRYNTLAQE